MHIKKKINRLSRIYIFFLSFVLLINLVLTTSLKANSFKITDLKIFEPFDLNFNKEKVIDKAFKKAFTELYLKITTSGDKSKIKDTSLISIKGLIDSFTINNESFVNSEYQAEFDVNFNKENVLDFFETKNTFPSIPQKKKILFIPIIFDVQKDKISLFTNNIFYEKWNEINERYFLLNYLLPSEDIEDLKLILNNRESIESYDFKEIILKYDLNHYIISIIYKNKKELSILSKIKLNEYIKINNIKFKNRDISNSEDFEFIVGNLKIVYEDYWKKINQINTSIKIPLTLSIETKQNKKIENFEKTLKNLDLVSNFEILKLNSENIFYKIIYNGSPNRFIADMKEKNIIINNQNQVWTIE